MIGGFMRRIIFVILFLILFLIALFASSEMPVTIGKFSRDNGPVKRNILDEVIQLPDSVFY